MKTQDFLSRLRLPCHGPFTVTIILALAVSSAWAKKPPKPPPEPESGYQLVDLVGLEGGQSVAWRINDAGWVVGESAGLANINHAFVVIPEDTNGDGEPDLWARDDNGDGLNDLLIDLGVLGGGENASSHAYGVNDYGQVVGNSKVDEIGPAHAFLWQPDTSVMLDLGRLDGNWAVAWAINNQGQVVGYTGSGRGFLINPIDTNGDEIPDTWYADAGNGVNVLMIDLGSVDSGLGIDINDAGEIAGTSERSAFLIRPVDVDGNGALDWFVDENGDGFNDLMIPLPLSGRSTDSSAAAINSSGLIAGNSGDDVVLWQVDAAGAISELNLGQIKSYNSTGPSDINDGGQVVGSAASMLRVGPPPKWKRTAWLSENANLIKLAEQVSDWGPFDKGFSRAFGINEYGAIVGDMYWHAFIAIPTP